MAATLPREGFRDLFRRARIAGLWLVRLRVRSALVHAETELGFLGWEQVDFFDESISAEVTKVQEFENTQASLMNTSAELSGCKAALDEELARENALHDEAQAALATERQPFVAQFEQAESQRRLKVEAIERFNRAIAEFARLENRLEARSLGYLKVERPTDAIRAEAREVSDELSHIANQRQILLTDKTHAAGEIERIESVIANLRGELRRIDAAASAARDSLAAATRRLTAEMSNLDRQKKKSSVHMSRLDSKKRKPYRIIGACLADHGIAPLNQPQMLEKVMGLRERDACLVQTLTDLWAACAAASAGVLAAFYLLLAAVLAAVSSIAWRFLH